MTDEQKALVENNRKLVFAVINRNFPWLANDDDVISCGMMGLCLAASKFDESKGVPFSSFAWTCISNEIGMWLRKAIPIKQNELSLVTDSEEKEDGETDVLHFRGEEDKRLHDFEFSEDVEKAMSVLSEDQRHIIKEYMSGKSVAQVGKDIGLSRQATHVKFQRAIRTLEERLHGYND